LFVLFDLGPGAELHKTLAEIATKPLPVAADRKNPCLKRLPNRMVFPGIHGVVIGRERRVAILALPIPLIRGDAAANRCNA
jgi:hypothetical protein